MPDPKLNLFQANIDDANAWIYLENPILAKLETAEVPCSAVRMEQTGVASGIALIIEQAPMLGRAVRRRPHWRRTETALAGMLLTCAGNHYDRPDQVDAARNVRLSLVWPEPYIPMPDPVRNDPDTADVAAGRKSPIMVVMQRYDITCNQAIAHLRRVAEDDADDKVDA